MRSPIAGGVLRAGMNGIANSQNFTNSVGVYAGTEVNLDVPKGHVALVWGSVHVAPSANTAAAYLQVDGVSQAPVPSLNSADHIFFSAEVPDGKHKINVAGNATSAAGTMYWPHMVWIIVPKGR